MTASATAEVTHAQLTLDEAAKNLRAARACVDTLSHSYQDIRRGSRESDIARVRVQWGLALSIWVDALIAQEEARDREHIERRRRTGSAAARKLRPQSGG
jgi:hypothetical protein